MGDDLPNKMIYPDHFRQLQAFLRSLESIREQYPDAVIRIHDDLLRSGINPADYGLPWDTSTMVTNADLRHLGDSIDQATTSQLFLIIEIDGAEGDYPSEQVFREMVVAIISTAKSYGGVVKLPGKEVHNIDDVEYSLQVFEEDWGENAGKEYYSVEDELLVVFSS